MRQLITIAQAAVLVRKHRTRIYAWVRAGKLHTVDTDDGMKVRPADVLRVAANTRRGRPRD